MFWLVKKAFFFPDAAIQKSALNPPDGEYIKARNIYIVPNGCPDQFERFRNRKLLNFVPVVLFVGLVMEDKGVEILIEAARLLRERGQKFQVRLVGEFTSEEYRQKLVRKVADKGLEQWVDFCGRKVGDEKWDQYQNADIFCFPTHYSAESFGMVLLEAMMFELPVVTTAWRGIPGIVEDGITGFLTEIKDAAAVTDRLERLLDDEDLRRRMGRAGRERYLEKFTVELYVKNTTSVVLAVANKKHGHELSEPPVLAAEHIARPTGPMHIARLPSKSARKGRRF